MEKQRQNNPSTKNDPQTKERSNSSSPQADQPKKADQSKKSDDQSRLNEGNAQVKQKGEGDYAASKDYGERTKRFVESGEGKDGGQRAKEALEGDEGDELKEAERTGKSKMKEEDRLLHRKN